MNRPSGRAQLRGLLIYPLAAMQGLLVFQPKDFTEFLFGALVSLVFGVGYGLIGYVVRDASEPGQSP